MTIEPVEIPNELLQKAQIETTNSGHHRVPPFQAGDFLTRPEFERRYDAHPEIKKAELIEGIVYIAPPVSVTQHGELHFDMVGWLGIYCASTPGIRGSNNASLRLDFINEPQPDILLRVESEFGGQSAIDDDDYLCAAPELIVEIAASSTSYDLYQKKAVYERHGVQEYLVIQMHEQVVSWFVLRENGYQELAPDPDGILRSEVFPGLWLQPAALWRNEITELLAVLQQGLASTEHQVFVEALNARFAR